MRRIKNPKAALRTAEKHDVTELLSAGFVRMPKGLGPFTPLSEIVDKFFDTNIATRHNLSRAYNIMRSNGTDNSEHDVTDFLKVETLFAHKHKMSCPIFEDNDMYTMTCGHHISVKLTCGSPLSSNVPCADETSQGVRRN